MRTEHFLEVAKQPAPHPDLVCIGKGSTPCLKSELGVDYSSIYCDDSFGWMGSLNDSIYYLKKSEWERIFGKSSKLDLPDGIPEPPECPAGYHYEARGYGWKGKDVMVAWYENNHWRVSKKPFNTRGLSFIYYLEIVKNEEMKVPNGIPSPPPCPTGYHYEPRGYGWVADKVDVAWYDARYGRWHVNANNKSNSAVGAHDVYYLEIVKDEEDTKIPSLKEQIEYAKTFIGKKIKSRANYGFAIVSGFEIRDEFVGSRYDPTPNKTNVEKIIEQNGAYVYLTSESAWSANHNKSVAQPVCPVLMPAEIYKETIKVNGYEAEDRQNYYKFGCAEIDKDTLRAAKAFLEENKVSGGLYGNRQIESVKIGAGDFTLETLSKLSL